MQFPNLLYEVEIIGRSSFSELLTGVRGRSSSVLVQAQLLPISSLVSYVNQILQQSDV